VSEDFVTSLGLPLLSHRLRRAAEAILEATGTFLERQGFGGPPRSVSTLLLLAESAPLGITEISARLKLTHPLIIKLVRALTEAGYVREERDPADSRRRLISLTPEGARQAALLRRVNRVVARALERLAAESGADLFDAVARFEEAVAERTLIERLEDARGASPDG
jgi:DNA-binding MarR family transcriptional regulator